MSSSSGWGWATATVEELAPDVAASLHDIASERKVGLDLLRIGSGIVSGIIGAKSGMVGKGAMVADLLFKAVSSFRKKKNPDS